VANRAPRPRDRGARPQVRWWDGPDRAGRPSVSSGNDGRRLLRRLAIYFAIRSAGVGPPGWPHRRGARTWSSSLASPASCSTPTGPSMSSAVYPRLVRARPSARGGTRAEPSLSAVRRARGVGVRTARVRVCSTASTSPLEPGDFLGHNWAQRSGKTPSSRDAGYSEPQRIGATLRQPPSAFSRVAAGRATCPARALDPALPVTWARWWHRASASLGLFQRIGRRERERA